MYMYVYMYMCVYTYMSMYMYMYMLLKTYICIFNAALATRDRSPPPTSPQREEQTTRVHFPATKAAQPRGSKYTLLRVHGFAMFKSHSFWLDATMKPQLLASKWMFIAIAGLVVPVHRPQCHEV